MYTFMLMKFSGSVQFRRIHTTFVPEELYFAYIHVYGCSVSRSLKDILSYICKGIF